MIIYFDCEKILIFNNSKYIKVSKPYLKKYTFLDMVKFFYDNKKQYKIIICPY